jgi:Icc protein
VNSSSAIRIAQLSDTHFLAAGDTAEGGFAYDTNAAFDAVAASIAEQDPFDLVVVTGDVADHGTVEQYHNAAAAFAQLAAPVNVCPGNHDQDATFTAAVGRPTVGTSRVIEIGSWCFVFVDSNAGVQIQAPDGRWVDPPDYDDRLHGNGSLGEQQANWLTEVCATTRADHVFVWVHHPPAPSVGLSNDADYEAEWRALMPKLSKVRGMGAGHTHVPARYDFEDRTVFVSPALKNNFDLDAETLLPPGYRSYVFSPDGTVTSEVHLVDEAQWPRHPLGRATVALFKGELDWDEFNAIVARKRAESAS